MKQGGEEEEEERHDEDEDEQEDEPQDEDEVDGPDGPVTPWDLTPGSLSSRGLQEAMDARAVFHATIGDVARRNGKKISTVFTAIGDHPKTTRDANPWNAFEMKYRTEHPKKSKSTCLR